MSTVTGKYNKILEEYNLTYTQYVVMMYFWEVKESNVTELGNTLLLDSSTLTPLLKKLESKGYLERKRSLLDERNLLIKLTKKGDNLKDKVLNVNKEVSKCFNLDKKEAEELYNLLYKVLNNIEEEQ